MKITTYTKTGFRILPAPSIKRPRSGLVQTSALKTSPEDIGTSLDEKTQLIIDQIVEEANLFEDDETRDLWLDGVKTFSQAGDIEQLIKLTEYRRKVVPLDEFMFSKSYLGLVEDEIYPAVSEICNALDTDKYTEAILTGAIGYGKSFTANIMLARGVYKISCMRHPQSTYGIQSRSSIVFTIQSVRLTTAKKAVFEEFGKLIRQSPYFKHIYPFDPMILSSMVFREQYVSIMPVSSSTTGVISMNVIAGILDELNFMQKIQKSKSQNAELDGSYSQAKMIYNNIANRRKTRFAKKGKLPGLLFLISSSRFPDDFTEKRSQDSTLRGGTNPYLYVYATSIWEGKGRGHYSGDSFRLMIGDSLTRSKILELNEQPTAGFQVIDVPTEFLPEFTENMEGSLHDLAGIPTIASRPFISNRNAIFDCVTGGKAANYQNPFDSEQYCFSYGIPRPNRDKLRTDINMFRACHIDLGWKRDGCGIAIGHIAGQKLIQKLDTDLDTRTNELMPVIGFDVILRVVPPPNGEIEFAQIRNFVVMLRDEFNLPIEYLSMDGFQCLAGNTFIWTQRGMVFAEDIVEGDIVQSRIGPRPVTKKWAFGKQKALRITTDHGHTITVTRQHKLEAATKKYRPFSLGGPVWGWVKADQLKVGQIVRTWDGITELEGQGYIKLKYVAGERRTHFHCPEYLDESFALFLGLLWGDGYLHSDFMRLTVTPEDVNDAIDAFKVAIDATPRVKEYHDRNCYDLEFGSRAFMEFLRVNGLVKHGDGFPILLMRSNRRVQAAFIRGLFSTDGSVKTRDGQPSFSTKNLPWARYIQDFLRMAFGIETCLTASRRMGDHYRTDNEFQYILSVRGSRQRFYDAIGFYYTSKQNKLEAHLDVPGRRLTTKIISIEECEADVYDFEVQDDHSYLANGFVSHNSVDSRQIFRKLGFKTDYISVEAMEPYRTLRDAIYDQRILLMPHEFLQNELAGLEYVLKNSLREEKVDHRQNGTKDVADAVAGVTQVLFTRRIAWSPILFKQKEEPEKEQVPEDEPNPLAKKLGYPDRKPITRKRAERKRLHRKTAVRKKVIRK